MTGTLGLTLEKIYTVKLEELYAVPPKTLSPSGLRGSGRRRQAGAQEAPGRAPTKTQGRLGGRLVELADVDAALVPRSMWALQQQAPTSPFGAV